MTDSDTGAEQTTAQNNPKSVSDNKIDIAALTASFEKVIELSNDRFAHYDKWKIWFQLGTYAFRTIAAIILLVAAILAMKEQSLSYMLFGKIRFANEAQGAVALLMIASLVAGFNRFFLTTASWSRYSNAMVNIRILQAEIITYWTNITTKYGDKPIPDSDVEKIHNRFDAFTSAVNEVVKAETVKWTKEMDEALDALDQIIASQKTAAVEAAQTAKTAAEARQAAEEEAAQAEIAKSKAENFGGLEITIKDVDKVLEGKTYEITCGSKKETRKGFCNLVTFEGLQPGAKTVSLAIQGKEDAPFQRAALIKANDIEKVELTIIKN